MCIKHCIYKVLDDMLSKIVEIYNGWKNWLLSFFRKTSVDELAKSRLSTCNLCGYNVAGVCTSCGCLLRAKVYSATSFCPINAWEPILYEPNIIYLSEVPKMMKISFSNWLVVKGHLVEEEIDNDLWEEFLEQL